MITDGETDFLYLADSLISPKYSLFLERFQSVLAKHRIPYKFLDGTNDIWAVDYMPVQISTDKFIQFTYKPDYLQPKKYHKTISDVDSICKSINLTAFKSKLIVDGGNVIRTTDKIIMCDKVFKENPDFNKNQLINQLRDIFEIDNLIFVPWDKTDFTGHADGMVRFLDKDTVFINSYHQQQGFKNNLVGVLNDAGLKYIEIPYNPYNNRKSDQANGAYINYLQMKNIVFIPTFGLKEDDIAIKQFEKYFKTVVPVDSNEIALDGGILNCISWNIRIK